MKKFIVYRHYNGILYWTYERVELTKNELKEYLFNHQSELKNIEIFKKEERTKININVSIDII